MSSKTAPQLGRPRRSQVSAERRLRYYEDKAVNATHDQKWTSHLCDCAPNVPIPLREIMPVEMEDSVLLKIVARYLVIWSLAESRSFWEIACG